MNNFDDSYGFDNLGSFGEEDFGMIEEKLQQIADEDKEINEIASGKLNIDALKMFLASNTVSSSDSINQMLQYIEDNKYAHAMLSNLSSQMSFGQIGIVRVMMGLYGQQEKMLKYMNEGNTYLAIIMKRMEEYNKLANANRELGNEQQSKESDK